MDSDGSSVDDAALLPAAFGLSAQRYRRVVGEHAGASAPAPVRDAASVVLVRDRAGRLEVFLLHRVARMAFAGGMTVFPGGGLDDRDRDPDDRDPDDRDPDDRDPDDRDPDDAGTDPAGAPRRALRRSAVRELFEETGVLLAGPTVTTTVASTAGLATARTALAAGEADLSTVLHDAGLLLRDDLLLPWGRWTTPEPMPKRYDTHFLLAEVPPGQEPDGATSEAADAGWATPGEALSAWAAGERALMPPTWAVLSDLAEHADVAGLRAAAGGRRLDPVVPFLVPEDDGARLAVPRFALCATALRAAS